MGPVWPWNDSANWRQRNHMNGVLAKGTESTAFLLFPSQWRERLVDESGQLTQFGSNI